MPAALLSRDDVIERLMQVLRRAGYGGASLSELSKATGLGKSSLYHYFPDGKDDMVRAVLDHLAAQLESGVFAPMREPGTPKARLAAMVRTLDVFYRQGSEACVLAQLVLGPTHERFREPLRQIFTAWTDAIAGVLTDAGLPRRTARQRAQDGVVRIEGALILSSGLNDAAIFQRTLRSLSETLLAPAMRPS